MNQRRNATWPLLYFPCAIKIHFQNLKNHMLLHKLVEIVARLPSFASKADGFALNCIISSLWCLAKSPICCRILSETIITPSLMKIMIELNAREVSSLTTEDKNTRKRIVGLFFLMTSTNTKARHAILAEDYGHGGDYMA